MKRELVDGADEFGHIGISARQFDQIGMKNFFSQKNNTKSQFWEIIQLSGSCRNEKMFWLMWSNSPKDTPTYLFYVVVSSLDDYFIVKM